MNSDPREQLDEYLLFEKCGEDIECPRCDKYKWCGKMETTISILRDQIKYRERQMQNQAADERGDDYLPGTIVGG
jgi:hypothetical protein